MEQEIPSNGKFHQTDQSKLGPFFFLQVYVALALWQKWSRYIASSTKRVETVDCEVEKELMIGVDHDE